MQNRWQALLLLAAQLSIGCAIKSENVEYEIPAGYTGWVEVEYGRRDCPPVRTKSGVLRVRVGTEGRACIREQLRLGPTRISYYYVGAGRRLKLQATGPGHDGTIWNQIPAR